MAKIRITGARENNLKHIDVEIPHYRFVVVTGVSGSGKSSLVYDIIAKEGRRLFLENFPEFTGGKVPGKPEVDSIQGLFPVISIGQNSFVRNPRSTVGTMTELTDFFRLLFSRFAESETIQHHFTRSHFSFNSPLGQCPSCKGLGLEDHIDPELIVSYPEKSLREGAFALSTPNGYIIYSQVTLSELDKVCRAHKFSVDIPWKELSHEQQRVIWYGSDRVTVLFGKHTLESRLKWTGITARPRDEGRYKGILPVMEEILRRDRNPNILRFARSFPCTTCSGHRLRPESLTFKLFGKNFRDYDSMSIEDLKAWVSSLPAGEIPSGAEAVIETLNIRASALMQLGVGHLQLCRPSSTLSEGEGRRIRLGAQSLSGLTNVLYILDEPSAGLHPTEQQGLTGMIRKLTREGNTVIVTEHDEQTMLAADHIIDMGPGPGSGGGEIMFNGPIDTFIKNPPARSLTATYLLKRPKTVDSPTAQLNSEAFTAGPYHLNNLRNIRLFLWSRSLNVITGVSGSGKTSLTKCIASEAQQHKKIGSASFGKVIYINQEPIGRSPKSNPATYTGLSDLIRDLMAAQPESRRRGYKKGQFSFVVKGGRCEDCGGAGIQQTGMHFLGNVETLCETCQGSRFSSETLEIKYKGKNIREILNLSFADAHLFFEGEKKIRVYTEIMTGLGLGYLQLGQPSTTLSGGEAQRVKLASELARPATGQTLYILDEPTTGLHSADIDILLQALHKLTLSGHTVICTEHDPYFILNCSRIADLGPGSGHRGGELLYNGTPGNMITHCDTPTASALRHYMKKKILISCHPAHDEAQENANIILRGVRTHFLKNIEAGFLKNKINVVTGPGGSGKSTLIRHTLYAECQRRFTEGMPARVRQFSGKPGSPVLDSAQGLTPAILLSRRNPVKNPRSTVGTFSGIYDFYRLLFSRLADHPNHRALPLSSSFSFNHEDGACMMCKGLGQITICDPDKLITHPDRPVSEGAMDGSTQGRFYGETNGQYMATLMAAAMEAGISFSGSWSGLSEKAKNLALYGSGDTEYDVNWQYRRGKVSGTHRMKKKWPGLLWLIEDEYNRKHADQRGEAMLGLMKQTVCSECGGSRLKPGMLEFTIDGCSIAELSSMNMRKALLWLHSLERFFSDRPEKLNTVTAIATNLIPRLEAMDKCGLAYLSASRQCSGLSGGEFQRLKMAALLHAPLTGITYILDEPGFGLHETDLTRICDIVEGLKAQGNTIVASDHSPQILSIAEHVMALGPGSGKSGGEIVYAGNPAPCLEEYKRKLSLVTPGIKNPSTGIVIRGACANNLRNIDVDFGHQNLHVITGASGSGKTSLMRDVILESYTGKKPVNCASIQGINHYDDFIYIEQEVPSGNPLSTPLTYLGLNDILKKIFASLPMSVSRGFDIRHFSHHHREGRCPECEGRGFSSVSLDFWTDAVAECEACKGMRFCPETLDIEADGMNIGQLMKEPLETTEHILRRRLPGKDIAKLEFFFHLLHKTSCTGIAAGQAMSTLSGSELQRLKLVQSLRRATQGQLLILADEPGGGLSAGDVLNLLGLFDELLGSGHSLICVTHDPLILAHAGSGTQLGPGGGDEGGNIVARF